MLKSSECHTEIRNENVAITFLTPLTPTSSRAQRNGAQPNRSSPSFSRPAHLLAKQTKHCRHCREDGKPLG